MKVCIDFDGTLCPDPASEPPLTSPSPEAIALIKRLKREGHTVTITTCRGGNGPEEGWRRRHAIREISAYLRWYDIPYDLIHTGKPCCDLVIDARAVPFDGDWERSAAAIHRPGKTVS